MRYEYPAIFSEAADGVTVTFPDVPEAVTWGTTRPEAKERAADALITALSTYVEENRPNIPRAWARGCVGDRTGGHQARLARRNAGSGRFQY